MMNRPRVLVANPDPGIRRLLRKYFGNAGYDVMTADVGRTMLDQLRRSVPDIIILSAEMDGLEGVDLVSRVRAVTGTPLLVLTPAKGSVTQHAFFNAGADDCLDEPFLLEELAARVRRLLRRAGVDLGPRMLTAGLGRLEINWRNRSVSLGGWPLALTRQEFDVLAVLAKANGGTVSHEEILGAVWGGRHNSGPYLRRVVGSLRRKIEPNPNLPIFLITLPSSGYRLNAAEELSDGLP
jgi:two-component system KDP operon response regulator KdpE